MIRSLSRMLYIITLVTAIGHVLLMGMPFGDQMVKAGTTEARMNQALLTDEHGMATPANWQPGDDVIIPPPNTVEMAEERVKQDYECTDWYLCKKTL